MKAQANRIGKVLTEEEVRQDFRRRGQTVTSWARKHGFDVATVNQVLRGHNKASRGVGHKIAVLLGIKDGVIEEEDCAPCTIQGAQRGAQSESHCAP